MADRDIVLSQLPAVLIEASVIAQNIIWFSPVVVAFFWYRYDRVKIEQGQRQIAEDVRELVLQLENENRRVIEERLLQLESTNNTQGEENAQRDNRLLQLETANNDRHERDDQPQPTGIFEVERDHKGWVSKFKYNSPPIVHEENFKVTKTTVNFIARKIPQISRQMD